MKIAPRITVSPDAPKPIQHLVLSASQRDLASSPDDVKIWSALFQREEGVSPLGKWTGAAFLSWFFLSSWPGAQAFFPYQWGALSIGIGIVTGGSTLVVLSRRRERNRLRKLQEARPYYVDGDDLTLGDRDLLARAIWASWTVLRSEVHQRNLIDRQRNAFVLPRKEWEIAETLREHSRLVKAEPVKAEGTEVAALLDTRREVLQASFEGIERQVVALETYAAQVVTAHRRYRELHELLRTVRDDLAVAETEGMREAAAVAEALTTALSSAEKAAVLALPAAERKTA